MTWVATAWVKGSVSMLSTRYTGSWEGVCAFQSDWPAGVGAVWEGRWPAESRTSKKTTKEGKLCETAGRTSRRSCVRCIHRQWADPRGWQCGWERDWPEWWFSRSWNQEVCCSAEDEHTGPWGYLRVLHTSAAVVLREMEIGSAGTNQDGAIGCSWETKKEIHRRNPVAQTIGEFEGSDCVCC